MNLLSLFAGIGGIDLGLEQAGITTVGQVELDDFCRGILAGHWPDVPRHDDVRTAPAWWASEPRPTVDIVAGGFPCQPFSNLGKRLGTADERWGWPWFADVVRAVRPRYVLVENVPRLIADSDAFGCILGDLSEMGFDAEWAVLPACAFGAPHMRKRVFVLAYTPGDDGERAVFLPTAVPEGRIGARAEGRASWGDGWLSEPAVGRVAHGVPKRLVAKQNHAYGNAVVPAVVEFIGHRIMAREAGLAVAA